VNLTAHEICAEGLELPLTRIRLPLDPADREALEGMSVELEQPLRITDVYKLFRGELTLSSNEVLRVPTEIRLPGSEAVIEAQKNRNRSIAARLLPSRNPAMPVGTAVVEVSGLMGHDGKKQQLLLESPLAAEFPPSDTLEPPVDGTARIVGLNLLNFFNGDGQGGGFPTERGAKTLEEFHSQRERTKAAIARMQPDLLTVQELENDGFGIHGAARALLELLNETGQRDWAVVAPGTGRIGGDVITVGLFYRQDMFEAIGSAQVLDGPAFKGLSRRPLAQLFSHRPSGNTVLVVVNHLKSKGRCPDRGENTDQNDGQGCWNAARLAAVKAQLPWLEKLADEMGTENTIILGDMNAWRNEDPIRGFVEAGNIDVVEHLSGLPQHSFLYFGQIGTLDYAFVSAALLDHVSHAEIWHINARWPRNMELPRPWLRASDHDPVIVDLDFSQSATSN
jgi:predicted extracellular nuclease